MVTSGLFSSSRDDWATPIDLFKKIDSVMHFTLDVCASVENTKCFNFYSISDNGLVQPWCGVVWCNPPYGRQISDWVNRASVSTCPIVCLLPSRTDTAWFHEYVLPFADIIFLRGRLHFSGSRYCAPFPSLLACYNIPGGQLCNLKSVLSI